MKFQSFHLHIVLQISALIPSMDPAAFSFMREFLSEEVDIFQDYQKTKLITNEMPVLVTAIISILAVEHKENTAEEHFLPKSVSALFELLLQYRESFDKLAQECDGRDLSPNRHPAPVAECYPGLPLHSGPENFVADNKDDKNDSQNCEKHYPEACGITGGLGHLTCEHRVTKGFTAMKNGESPSMFAKPLFKRLKKRVKARKRVFIYDNCCNFHKGVFIYYLRTNGGGRLIY